MASSGQPQMRLASRNGLDWDVAHLFECKHATYCVAAYATEERALPHLLMGSAKTVGRK